MFHSVFIYIFHIQNICTYIAVSTNPGIFEYHAKLPYISILANKRRFAIRQWMNICHATL